LAQPSTLRPRVTATADSRRIKFGAWIVIGMVIHVPLAVLLYASAQLSTIHAIIIGCIGLVLIYRRAPLVQFAYLAAYIAGAEVLWRMTKAGVFWEYGKYLTIFVLIIALFNYRKLAVSKLSLFYLFLLLPGVLITVLSVNWPEARDNISGYFSGHVALVVCICFFSQTTFSKKQVGRLLWFLIMPVVSIAMLAFSASQTITEWSANSNNLASGGFSANQVSNTLGLGLLAIWVLLLYIRLNWFTRIAVAVLGLWFLAQALLTFSRGGVLTAIIPGILITIPILFDPRRRMQIIPLVIGVLIFALMIGPALDSLTNGALTQRYTETDKRALTGRDDIVAGDLNAFMEHPVLGVGVGLAAPYRNGIAAHTEYSRMLGEHGLLGLAALVLLIVMFLMNLQRNWKVPLARSMVISAALWAFIYLTQAAMRTVAPSLLLALIFAQFNVADPKPQAVLRRALYPAMYNPPVSGSARTRR